MSRRLLYALIVGLAVLPRAAWPQDDSVPAFKTLDSTEARAQACVTCHGQSGQGTSNGYFPRIAGKPAGYLLEQLKAFRDGRRQYLPMNYIVAYLPDDYLRELAQHFAALRPPFAAGQAKEADTATLDRGQSLVTAGDPAHGIPACAACHGKELTGMEPGMPGLVGLDQTYLVAQLTSWRNGGRHSAEPDCMGRVANRLTDSDQAAVAAWLARQTPPSDPSPLAASSLRPPLACGSQP